MTNISEIHFFCNPQIHRLFNKIYLNTSSARKLQQQSNQQIFQTNDTLHLMSKHDIYLISNKLYC